MTSTGNNGVVEFRFFRPNVRRVGIAADFNGWQSPGLEMKPTGGGWWSARVRLEAEEYRFRYLADGDWYTDYASYGVELGKMGWNSVLRVPEPRSREVHDDVQMTIGPDLPLARVG